MQLFSAVILVVLAVIGAAGVIRTVSRKLFNGKFTQNVYVVIPMRKDAQCAEQTLRGVAVQLGEGICRRAEVVCLDCGADAETKEICQKFSRGYPQITLMTPREFMRRIMDNEDRNAELRMQNAEWSGK